MKNENYKNYRCQVLAICSGMYSNIHIKELMLFQNKNIKVKNVRSFFEYAFIQKYLVRDGWKLIYVDEFHLSPKTSAIYSWSKKNTPACIAINSGTLILNFIVALSEQVIEGIMAAEKSIEGKTFYWFISDVWIKMWEKNGNEKVCIIIDKQHCINLKLWSRGFKEMELDE